MDDSPEAIDLDALPVYARERWPATLERARRKTAAVVPGAHAQQLVKASQKASSASQRVIWLHRAATAWSKPLEPVAACHKGCAHCCHIPVTISSIEADLIGRRVGLKPARPTHSVRLQAFADLQSAMPALQALESKPQQSSPCPFLQDEACSVYDVRPMACRLLVNLDDDDVLCRLVPGQAIPVPYANSQQLKVLYLLAQPATPFADIRDFFPRP